MWQPIAKELGISSESGLHRRRDVDRALKGLADPDVFEWPSRADYHWGPGYAAHTGPAYLDAIVFKYLPEASVRLGALTSGQVQAIDEAPPANLRSLQQDDRLEIVRRENPGVNRSLFLNISSPSPAPQNPSALGLDLSQRAALPRSGPSFPDLNSPC